MIIKDCFSKQRKKILFHTGEAVHTNTKISPQDGLTLEKLQRAIKLLKEKPVIVTKYQMNKCYIDAVKDSIQMCKDHTLNKLPTLMFYGVTIEENTSCPTTGMLIHYSTGRKTFYHFKHMTEIEITPANNL